MTPRLPDSVKHGQPHSVRLGRHHQWVTENLKSVLRDNLRALLGLAPGKSGVSALIKLGLSNGNAQRALGGETSVGLDVIAKNQVVHAAPGHAFAADAKGARVTGPDGKSVAEVTVDGPESLSVTGTFWVNGQRILIAPDAIYVGGVTMRGNRLERCGTGIQIG